MRKEGHGYGDIPFKGPNVFLCADVSDVFVSIAYPLHPQHEATAVFQGPYLALKQVLQKGLMEWSYA